MVLLYIRDQAPPTSEHLACEDLVEEEGGDKLLGAVRGYVEHGELGVWRLQVDDHVLAADCVDVAHCMRLIVVEVQVLAVLSLHRGEGVRRVDGDHGVLATDYLL